MEESTKKETKPGDLPGQADKDFTYGSPALHMSLIPYWFLAFLRIALTLLPQIGYIHPDEFFQSVEVLSGDIFGVDVKRPWEFSAETPIRSITLPYLVVGLPIFALKIVAPFISLWFNINVITPYTLLVIPRLTFCFFSFITDFCMYKICYLYGQNYRARLLSLASSYVMLVYATRTFTNSIEMALTSMLLYLVADCMARSDQIIYQDEYLQECYNSSDSLKDRIRFHRLRLALPWHSFSNVFYISTITVIGIFNRPTFLAFAFPPLFFWLQRGMGSRSIGLPDFNIRIFALIVCALPTFIILVTLDSYYFQFLTWDELIHKNFSLTNDFVVTPYNFIRYNTNSSNLSDHGIHPRFTHFLINIPLLFNVLGVAGLFSFFNIVYRIFRKRWSSLPRVQSIIGLMTTAFIIPIALLSLFPHQEARFIIPCTLPLVFLHSQKIRRNERETIVEKSVNGFKVFLKKDIKLESKDSLLGLWYCINISLTLFFGFLHQGGIYPLLNHFSKELDVKPRLTHVHVVTSHIYSLPTSLLHLKYGRAALQTYKGVRYQKTKDFFTYELGSSLDMDLVAIKLKAVLSICEKTWKEKRLKYRLYFVAPSSLTEDFDMAAFKGNLSHTLEAVFYPHVSTEALPFLRLDSIMTCSHASTETCHNDNFSIDLPLRYFSFIIHQFGLTLFRIRH